MELRNCYKCGEQMSFYGVVNEDECKNCNIRINRTTKEERIIPIPKAFVMNLVCEKCNNQIGKIVGKLGFWIDGDYEILCEDCSK